MPGPPRWTRRFLAEEDFEAITRAIASAEGETSAEIRVHLERRLRRRRGGRAPEALERAREVFAHLGMHRAPQRNGVLIYLAVEDRRLAIVGDEGIHRRVGDDYWAGIRDRMVERLRAGGARDAIVEAVAAVGRSLREHFPPRPDDTNELSDQVSVG